MRILLATILNPDEDTNGVMSHVFDLRRELLISGHTVDLLSIHERNSIMQRLGYALRRLVYLLWKRIVFSPLYLLILCMIAVRMGIQLRKNYKKYDLINAQDAVTATVALLVLPKSIPVLLTCHFWSAPWREFAKGGFVRFKRPTYYLIKSVFRAALRNSRLNLVSVSHSNLDLIKDICGEMDKKIPVIYSGQEVLKAPDYVFPEDEPNEKIVVNVGTIDQRKNQRFLVDIAAELNMLGKRWKYILIGPDDTPEAHYIRQKISDFKLEDQFHLLGEQDRTGIFTLLRQADIYFQTSKSESFGIALLEAIANDTLVLAMDYPALNEIMPTSTFTRFNQSMTAREVANRIAALENNVHLYREMRHQQFLHFAIQFAPELMRERYVKLYKGLIEEAAIPESLFENKSSFFYTSKVDSR